MKKSLKVNDLVNVCRFSEVKIYCSNNKDDFDDLYIGELGNIDKRLLNRIVHIMFPYIDPVSQKPYIYIQIK